LSGIPIQPLTNTFVTMLQLILFIALFSNFPGSHDNLFNSAIGSEDHGKWKMTKSTDGVQSFVRWTTNSDGTAVRERKGEISVQCTVQEAVSLLSDAGSTQSWMSGVDENYCLSQISKSEWYTYTLFSIPWPFNKRDLVSWCRMDADPSRGTVKIGIVCKDNYVPLKPGITRMTDYKASWLITRTGEKSIVIHFNATSSAPPILPRAIQDPVIEKLFHNNLVRLRDVLTAG
jgi:hypothetical protein